VEITELVCFNNCVEYTSKCALRKFVRLCVFQINKTNYLPLTEFSDVHIYIYIYHHLQ